MMLLFESYEWHEPPKYIRRAREGYTFRLQRCSNVLPYSTGALSL